MVQVSTSRDVEGSQVHVSAFGATPKKHKLNKWRLIVDLSSPDAHSVNDGIVRELTSLAYVSVNDVVAQILHLDCGTVLAKMDGKQAYRNVPVHPGDRPLLGGSVVLSMLHSRLA